MEDKYFDYLEKDLEEYNNEIEEKERKRKELIEQECISLEPLFLKYYSNIECLDSVNDYAIKVKRQANTYKERGNIEAYNTGYKYMIVKYGNISPLDDSKEIYDFEDFIFKFQIYEFYKTVAYHYFYDNNFSKAFQIASECEQQLKYQLKYHDSKNFFNYYSIIGLFVQIARAKNDYNQIKQYYLDGINACYDYEEVRFIYIMLAQTYLRMEEVDNAIETLKNPKCGFYGLEDLVLLYTTGFCSIVDVEYKYQLKDEKEKEQDIKEAYKYLIQLFEYNDKHNTNYISFLNDAVIAYILYKNEKYDEAVKYMKEHLSFQFDPEIPEKKYEKYEGDDILHDPKFLESTKIDGYYFVIGLMLYEGKACKQDIKKGIEYLKHINKMVVNYPAWGPDDTFIYGQSSIILFEYENCNSN